LPVSGVSSARQVIAVCEAVSPMSLPVPVQLRLLVAGICRLADERRRVARVHVRHARAPRHVCTPDIIASMSERLNPAPPPLLSPSCLSTHRKTDTERLNRPGNTYGEGLFLLGQPRGVAPALPNSWGSPASPLLRPTLFDSDQPNSAWKHLWGGTYFSGSAMPLHSAQCGF